MKYCRTLRISLDQSGIAWNTGLHPGSSEGPVASKARNARKVGAALLG